MVKCSKCESEVGDSKFCPNCGSKIVKPAPQENNTKKFCPNCGNEVGDSKFCPECGFEIATPTNNHSSSREKDIYDNIIDIDEKVSGKIGGLFKKK